VLNTESCSGWTNCTPDDVNGIILVGSDAHAIHNFTEMDNSYCIGGCWIHLEQHMMELMFGGMFCSINKGGILADEHLQFSDFIPCGLVVEMEEKAFLRGSELCTSWSS
jgi:hypothetical protein